MQKLPKSLPLRGRWQPAGLTEGVRFRIRMRFYTPSFFRPHRGTGAILTHPRLPMARVRQFFPNPPKIPLPRPKKAKALK